MDGVSGRRKSVLRTRRIKAKSYMSKNRNHIMHEFDSSAESRIENVMFPEVITGAVTYCRRHP